MELVGNERGSASIGTLIVLPLVLFFLLIVPDLLRLGAAYFTVQNIAQEGVSLMEKHGGMNDIVAQDIANWVMSSGLDPEKVSIETHDYNILFGDPIRLTVQTEVPLLAFRWLGQSVTVPVKVTKVGISKAIGPLVNVKEGVHEH